MAVKIIPEFPKCFFSSDMPAKVGKIIIGRKWNCLCMPDLRDVQIGNLVVPPWLKKLIELKLPPGIYFDVEKSKVKKNMPSHELYHWQAQYRPMGALPYLIYIAAQYKMYGYDGAPCEKQAKAAEKKGLDNPAKQAWWAAA